MSSKKNAHFGACPSCGVLSNSAKEYGTRHIRHFSIGSEQSKSYNYIDLRCNNSACAQKTFRYYPPCEGLSDIDGKSRYSKSSKEYAVNKLLTQHVSYNGLHESIQSDFGTKTSLYSLHTWTQKARVEEVPLPEGISVLHTDEKHPSKKTIVQ